jgi:osmoprotectant transport system substrate-binding protein
VKRSLRLALGLTVALALLGAACGDDNDDGGNASSSDDKPAVTIGAQDFGESKILAEIYKQGLEAKGFEASIQELGGFRDLEVKAFEGGTINFGPEYAASMLEFLNGTEKTEASGDVDATVDKLDGYLDEKNLAALDVSEAVDTNALVMKKDKAEELGITSLSDLATKGKDLVLGAPADCETNPFCIPGLKSTYSADLSGKFKALDAAAVPAALDAGEIQIGLMFSTDSRIETKGYLLLEDDKHMLSADNVLPVVTSELAGNSSLTDAVNAITAKLTTANLTALNKRYDVDKEDAAAIAKSFLDDNSLM